MPFIFFLYFGLSEIFSAIISKAPPIASSTFATILSFGVLLSTVSTFTKSFAISSKGFVSFCSIIIFARGSNPLAFATVARVFFFGLYGLYISSTSARVLASSIDFEISSVSFPCSSIDFTTSSFLFSKFLKYVNLSPKSLRVSSDKPPVTSFL